MAKNWYPVINEETCIECGKCIKKCAHGVYDKNSPLKPVIVHAKGCIDGCHGCGNICPTGSITYFGENTEWMPPNLKTEDKTTNNKSEACCSDSKTKSDCCGSSSKKKGSCC